MRAQRSDESKYTSTRTQPGVDHYALIEDYRSGMSMKEVAAKHECPIRAVSRRVKAEDITPNLPQELVVKNVIRDLKQLSEQWEIDEYLKKAPKRSRIQGHPIYYSKRFE